MRPLNGTKTHPLSKVAISALKFIRLHPSPRQSFNPGLVNRLEREELVETFQLQGAYKTVKGKTAYLKITDKGLRTLETLSAISQKPVKQLTKHEELLRVMCCNLANDAWCLERGSRSKEMVIFLLYEYAQEIAEAIGYDGPSSLIEYKKLKASSEPFVSPVRIQHGPEK